MLKTRLLLIGICVLVIWIIFQLPKSVVENQSTDMADTSVSVSGDMQSHVQAPKEIGARIAQVRRQWSAGGTRDEKNAIFADSLANLYRVSNRFDSAGWFAEEAAKFFNNAEHWTKAGDNYYQAFTLAIDQVKQKAYAAKAQEYYSKVLQVNPQDLEVKNRMAMTYVNSSNPMQGIMMLREVLASDPKNESALFNMGMLSIQSGQNERAIERLESLVKINPAHIQGQLLLGIAMMNSGDRKGAKAQFEKVKQMDKDPAVQATADSYLKDLK
jgi:tetratricopeptide (TPR) repeat protein